MAGSSVVTTMNDIETRIAALKDQLQNAIADGDFPAVVSLYNRLEMAKSLDPEVER
jgi:hypothetical protein